MKKNYLDLSLYLSIFFIFAIVYLIIGWHQNQRIEWMHENGIRTQAIVTDAYTKGRSNTVYVISFTDRDENIVITELPDSGGITVGEKIEILYSPDDPKDLILADQGYAYFLYFLSASLLIIVFFIILILIY